MTIFKFVVALLALVALLGGCTSSNPRTVDESGRMVSSIEDEIVSPTGSPTPVVSTSSFGISGGTLTAIAMTNIPHRDVHRTVSETLSSRGPGIVYSRLLRLRMNHSIAQPSLLLECDLCESWEMSDPFTYRFHLRPGVLWHDLPPVDGRRLTAEDLAFSYQRQRSHGLPNAPLLFALDTAQAEDELTLKVTLKFPDVDFLLSLADGHSKVVAREAVEAVGGLESGPVVGTGPWVWMLTQEDDSFNFEANLNYFEENIPFLRRLSFKVIPDQDIQLAAFLNGEIDVYDVPSESWSILNAAGLEYETFLSKQSGRGLIIAMNISKFPFDDMRVRRGVFKALSPWAYLEEIWSGHGFVSTGMPVVRESWLLADQEISELVDSLDYAEHRSDNSGVAFDLIVADFGDAYLDQGLRIERDLRSAGFIPNLKVMDPVEYSEHVWNRKDYQLFVGPVPPTSSINSYLFSMLHSEGQWNILAHNDQILNQLIQSQQEAPYDSVQRKEVIQAIQRRLLERAYMVAPVSNGINWALQGNVRGFYPNTALSEYFYWAKVWLSQ